MRDPRGDGDLLAGPERPGRAAELHGQAAFEHLEALGDRGVAVRDRHAAAGTDAELGLQVAPIRVGRTDDDPAGFAGPRVLHDVAGVREEVRHGATVSALTRRNIGGSPRLGAR
jgi:hypothetical protein